MTKPTMTPREGHYRDICNQAQSRLRAIYLSGQAGGASMTEVLREVSRVADMIASRLDSKAEGDG